MPTVGMPIKANDLQVDGAGMVMLVTKWEGANGGNLTKVEGTGVDSIVRTGEGLYTVTLTDRYPAMVAFAWGISADTMADVETKVCVLDEDSYSASAGTIAMSLADASTLDDLEANEFLSLILIMRTMSFVK